MSSCTAWLPKLSRVVWVVRAVSALSGLAVAIAACYGFGTASDLVNKGGATVRVLCALNTAFCPPTVSVCPVVAAVGRRFPPPASALAKHRQSCSTNSMRMPYATRWTDASPFPLRPIDGAPRVPCSVPSFAPLTPLAPFAGGGQHVVPGLGPVCGRIATVPNVRWEAQRCGGWSAHPWRDPFPHSVWLPATPPNDWCCADRPSPRTVWPPAPLLSTRFSGILICLAEIRKPSFVQNLIVRWFGFLTTLYVSNPPYL